jgi:CRISPR/Cas system-associated endonuclease Cas3-HD
MKRYHVLVGLHDTGTCSIEYKGSFVTHDEALAAQEKAARQHGFNSRWCDYTILETQPDGSLKEV